MTEATQYTGTSGATAPAQRNVTVLGLGIMGSAIAGHLVGAGYRVAGYDPDPVRARAAADAGVAIAD